ncbi:MAG: DNA-binding response regulator [Proteobacteria bacterium]|nr:MAG: DNA-binding response regulator [Pseudomonadota bacterium]
MKTLSNALILEDHTETRQVLQTVLQDIRPGIHLYEAASLRQARQKLYEQRRFDLVIVDIGLPDGDGTDFVREVAQTSTNSYIVICTIYDDDHHIFKALRAGANGYLVKEHSRQELAEMLKGILNGQPPLSPAVAQHILDFFHTLRQEKIDLTPRETQVLTILAKGYNRKEIADMLELTSNTISWYIKQIYQKLDVHSRAEATLEASRMGLVG